MSSTLIWLQILTEVETVDLLNIETGEDSVASEGDAGVLGSHGVLAGVDSECSQMIMHDGVEVVGKIASVHHQA